MERRLMNARIRRLAVAAVLAGCAPSTSEVRERPEPPHPNAPAAANATFAYYEVSGTTAAELYTSMRQAAPLEGFGQTRWDVSWSMRWLPTAGVCRATLVQVTLRTEVRLPHWEPGPGASPELVAQWRAFVENLRSHENGHLEIAVAAAREVERELRQVQTPLCASMQGVGNQAGERVLAGLRARDRAYDQRTHHGFTQGAVWPPRSAGALPAETGKASPTS
jgi:predicted secreted Zn-dependent protease